MERDLPVWPEQRTDLKLQIAEHAAIQSGVITPLLKEELWTKIQHARLERGLEELKVEVTPPIKTPLTNEEETKVATRREKNRQAAVRCRQKRKTKQKDLEHILEEEVEKNNSLRALYQSLQNQKYLLMAQLGLSPTSPPEEEPARLWTLSSKEEPACTWTPPLKEEPSCSWTPPPKEMTSVWTPVPTPPPKEDSYIWNPAPTPTLPPTEDLSWQTQIASPKCWTFTTPQKDHFWMQKTQEDDLPSPPPPEDELPSPPPPECFSYWLEDELQVVPGEGCSNLHL
ncbi:protein fosB-like isoform X2 [Mizuhopecten yessoensis]|nr:protein fosB-like isoform X2 [Mizuhopecten yessoensis]